MTDTDPSTVTTLAVEHLFTATVTTSIAAFLATGPAGGRVVVNAGGGSFEGRRIKGTVLAPGGDWVTLQPDGAMRLDVRLTLQTDDGAAILMTYNGIATNGGASIRVAPRFETADERYAWLNSVQAVGLGRTGDGSVSYDVFQIL